MARKSGPTFTSTNSTELWSETTAEYELSRHEKVILESACRELDIVEKLEEALDGASLIVAGSMGQDTANPLLQEVRMHRAAVATLIKALKLPEAEEGEKTENPRSSTARAAANARWGTGGA